MAETFLELKKNAEKYGLIESVVKSQIDSGDFTKEEFFSHIKRIADAMIESIKNGISNDKLSLSKLSGGLAGKLNNMGESPLVNSLNKKIMTYALAVIEQNAAMGKIAACPTAGSSGIVPSVLIASFEELNKAYDDLINALILAGEVGRIISLKMPLAGAVAGCQAECGVASAMAASGLCYFLNADIDVIFNAIALDLKNILGLTCDPVAGLVEVPCVKRNIFLACHAVNSSYVAMSGLTSHIPLDEVVDAMRETGMLMSPKLKESSEAGLATTKTGILIKNSLYKIWHEDKK